MIEEQAKDEEVDHKHPGAINNEDVEMKDMEDAPAAVPPAAPDVAPGPTTHDSVANHDLTMLGLPPMMGVARLMALRS